MLIDLRIFISFPTVSNGHKIENILLAALVESSDLKTYGNDVCLHDLIKNLINLEENGINFTIRNEQVNVNSILECNKSFNAHSYCRLCKTKKNQAEYVFFFFEIEQNLRNKKNYLIDLAKKDSQDTGLKGETILNKVPSFHFTDNMVVDIMHDLFEGVLMYDICKTILLLIENNKSSNL